MFIKNIPLNNIITLYSDDLDEDFLRGYIVDYNEDEIIIACVDKYGISDGFLWLKTNHIYRIDYGSMYENKIEQLYYLKKQTHEKIDLDNKNYIDSILEWTYKNKKIVTFKFENDDFEVMGYIKGLKPFNIEMLDQYECKENQGCSNIDPGCARYIRVDDMSARDIELVYNYKKGE